MSSDWDEPSGAARCERLERELRELRAAHARLEAVLDNAEDAILLADAQAKPVLFNTSYAKTVKALLGIEMKPGFQPHTQLPPEEAAVWEECHRRVLAGETFVSEYLFKLEEGKTLAFETSFRPIFSEGAVVGFSQVTRDTTERRRASEQAHAMRDLALALSSTPDVRSALSAVLESAGLIEDVDAGGAYLVDPETDALELAFHRGLSAAFISRVRHYGQDAPEVQLLQSGTPIYGSYLDVSPVRESVHEAEGLRALAVLPLFHEGRLLGALNLTSRGVDEFPPMARAEMEAFAAQIGDTLARIRAVEASEQSLKKLQANEERLRSLVEETSDAVFCYEYDPPIPTSLPVAEQVRRLYDGVLADCNLVCARSYGADQPEAVVGKRLTELFGSSKESLDELFSNMIEGGYRTVDGEGVEQLPDGSHRYFLNNAHGTVEDGLLKRVWGTFRDITARKQAQLALRQQKELTAAAIDAQVDTFFIFDAATGRPVQWNRSFSEASGYSDEEIASMKAPDDWYDADDLERAAAEMAAMLHGGYSRVEMSLVTRSGERIPTEYHASVLRDPEGRFNYIIAVGRDVSERRRSEAERRHLETQVQHSQKLESLGVLAGGIAHDFNNLLVGILGKASLALLDLPPDSPVRLRLRDIETASKRASDLCNQLLAYSGRGRFRVSQLDLSHLVGEMVDLMRVSTSKKAVIRLALGDDVPPVNADATQLRQIVLNLVVNASEAIGDERGEITVSTGAARIDRATLVQAYLDEDLPEGLYTYVEVSDNGCGMDAATQARLFDPFFTTKFAGRGLGLSAVLGIVRAHQGTITIRSRPGHGSAFRVLLPSLNAPEDLASTAPDAEQHPAWRGEGMALVVDDEPPVREVAKEMLQSLGFTVLTAADGREGIDRFAAHSEDIVVALVDLTMPELGGEETLREIQRLRKGVPVVLMSGFGEANRAASRDAAAFIQKPFTVTELEQTIRRALSD